MIVGPPLFDQSNSWQCLFHTGDKRGATASNRLAATHHYCKERKIKTKNASLTHSISPCSIFYCARARTHTRYDRSSSLLVASRIPRDLPCSRAPSRAAHPTKPCYFVHGSPSAVCSYMYVYIWHVTSWLWWGACGTTHRNLLLTNRSRSSC